jgi:sugar lactone lactonase YvrE
MSSAGKILVVNPPNALPGAEIEVVVEGFSRDYSTVSGCFIDDVKCREIAASRKRILAEVPTGLLAQNEARVQLASGDDLSNAVSLWVAGTLAEDMHIVANPAVDPKDGSLVITRSGSRGQQLPHTLYRLESDGYLDELPVEILNPTGLAFGPDNSLYATNRAEGTVYRIDRGEEAVPFAKGLGIATGLAFNSDGVMFVGDRSGTIYRILADGTPDAFAKLDPSVAAYHMAFAPDGRLFVTAPGLASFEGVVAVDSDGHVESYFRGLGRPQGLAFDREGSLYVAACYGGRRGIFRIKPGSDKAEHLVAGNSIVGLCFNRSGDMIVATGETVYTLSLNIFGTLLK